MGWGKVGVKQTNSYVGEVSISQIKKISRKGNEYDAVKIYIIPLREGIDVTDNDYPSFSDEFDVFRRSYNLALGLPENPTESQVEQSWKDSFFAEWKYSPSGRQYTTKDNDGNEVVKDSMGIEILQLFPNEKAAMAHMNGGASQPQETASTPHPDVAVVASYIENLSPDSDITRTDAEKKIASVLVSMGDNVKVTDMAIQRLLDDKFESDNDGDIPPW